jgi:hypothetical protein
MKKEGLLLFLSWIIFGISMTFVGEYIISRPTNGLIQLICILLGLILAVTLVKQTADLFNKFFKK